MPTPTQRERRGEIPASVQRVVISELDPKVDCQGTPVKASVGESLPISVRVFSDGRLVLGARVRWRIGAGGTPWASSFSAELSPGVDDWWSGSLVPDQCGPAEYRVEAWENQFGTWRADVLRRQETGVDPGPEIALGWQILRSRLRFLPGALHEEAAAALAAAGSDSAEQQLSFLTSDRVALELARIVPPRGLAASTPVPFWVERARAVFGSWYELFPRSQGSDGLHSGTLRATTARIPEIAQMGFDVLYLTPIHPIGHTGRRGRNNAPVAEPQDPGSPWAIGSSAGGHTAIHQELGTLADFRELLAAADRFDLEVALDYALQCSPDHPWVTEHPGWFLHRPDGSIRPADNPPKRYDDIYPLDFQCAEWPQLWRACYQILEYWIEQGVRIFRVDNPHTKPVPFWRFVVNRLRRDHRDVLLLAEAFTRPAMMRELGRVGFSQSYSYFTWRNTKEELTTYFTELTTETVDYLRPNLFVTTPDILSAELQSGGPAVFRSRLVLAATLGASYGIYSGYEVFEGLALHPDSEDYLDSEKYQFRPRSLDGVENLVPLISRLNLIRRQHPALQQFRRLHFHAAEDQSLLCYSKRSADGSDVIMVVVNLDPSSLHSSWLHLDLDQLGITEDATFTVEDLISGAVYSWRGAHNFVRLDPDQAPAHVLWVRP
jgi:starch synthase (maltosyl-transferring)